LAVIREIAKIQQEAWVDSSFHDAICHLDVVIIGSLKSQWYTFQEPDS
jgi:hypothetical protein